ncbi:MAG: alanine racemase [Pyrinomonadaceae bacterium]
MRKTFDTKQTRAEIDLENLAFNFHSIRKFVSSDVKVMGVVKADAYGHGSIQCSKRLESEGVDWLGVASIEEAIELRDSGIRIPILCFRGSRLGLESLFLDRDITPSLFDIDRARELDHAAGIAGIRKKVHLKIDTGMGRVGVPYQNIALFADQISGLSNLEVEGVMTHFACADDLTSELTTLQIDRFNNAIALLREKGIRPRIIDMANSPGAVAFPESHASMVRIGGLLYGLGDDVLPKGIDRPELRPVMSVKSEIAFLKSISSGEGIGYGQTFSTSRDSVIATVPIGYYDGYRRALSNRSRVIVNGRFAPVVGRISMDWTAIDVTDIKNVRVGDEVILIGNTDGNQIKAEELAQLCESISYETTCGISKRVPRIYLPEMV